MTFTEAADVAVLGGLLALVAWRARPITEAVRLRNAVLLQRGRAEDFTWTPPSFPPDFKVERLAPPPEFRDIVTSLVGEGDRGDWENALTLATHLTEHVEDRGPIQADLLTTYRAIRNGYGYCADFVRIFLALAHSCGLIARQWAFSFDGFGGHGHTVVEVFDRQRKKWLLIDVLNNFHAIDVATGEPLSALEYRDALLGKRPPAATQANGPGRLGFPYDHKAVDYYQRGINQWYMWWGNAVFSYDANPLVRWSAAVSNKHAHLAAIVVGVQPRIRIYETAENAAEVRRIFALRRILFAGGAVAIVLALVLVFQLMTSAGDPMAAR